MPLSDLQAKILKIMMKRKVASSIVDICRLVNDCSLTVCQQSRTTTNRRHKKYFCDECQYKYSSVRSAVLKLVEKGYLILEKGKFSDEFVKKGHDLMCRIILNEKVFCDRNQESGK